MLSGGSFQVKSSDEYNLSGIIHLQMLFGICNLLVEKNNCGNKIVRQML